MIRDATDGRDGLMDCDFGTLLRQFRRSAGLTQEALAERSQISVDAISALERRRRKTPHRDTVSLLAAGLELKSDQHQALVAAAEHERPRGVTGPVAGSSSPRQLPRAPAGFVGRSAEIDALSSLLSTAAGTSPVAVCAVVSGMGGIGKTALAVQIAHRVAGQFPDGQVFVDMHGQSLGGSLWPQDAIAQVLRAFGSTMDDDGGDLAATAALYRSRMAGRRALLVLDDVRELDQLIPLLPGTTAAPCSPPRGRHCRRWPESVAFRWSRCPVLKLSSCWVRLPASTEFRRNRSRHKRWSSVAEICRLPCRLPAPDWPAAPIGRSAMPLPSLPTVE